MAGMYCICDYENFSITDVGKFERRMRKFCNEANMPGKSMLIFDKSSLKVEGTPEKIKEENGEYYKVELPNISFTYTQIADSEMCIMHRVWENKTQSVLYNMPRTWDGTELWLCY